MRHPSDIGDLKIEPLCQLAPDGKIKGVRVRGLDFVVQAPGDGESTRVQCIRECLRELARRRRKQDLLWRCPAAPKVCGRNNVHVGQAGRAVAALNAGWIAQARGQAARTRRVKGVQEARTVAVVHNGSTSPDHSLVALAKERLEETRVRPRSPCQGQARTEVFLIPFVEARFSSICRTRKLKRD